MSCKLKPFCSTTAKPLVTLQNDLLPTLHSLIQFCAKRQEPVVAKACHTQVIIRFGLTPDALTSNMLLHMYSECDLIDSAHKLFDKMPERTFVSWNTLISSYAKKPDNVTAMSLFLEMQRHGKPVTEFTLTSIVSACAAKRDSIICKQLHASSVKAQMDTDAFVGTALLDFYAKCGLIHEAVRVFERMEERSDVTWSSMVAGFVQNELYDEALMLFSRARTLGLTCNQFTVSSLISACAGLATLIEGRQMHTIAIKSGFMSNNYIASSLVDMYAKCGSIKDAYIAFIDAEGVKASLVLWNVIISAFARHSRCFEAMILFEKMQQLGICPDEVTYVSVLSACSHFGLVDRGRTYFNLMETRHKIPPKLVHYSCMVDILSRAGQPNEAHELMQKMPFSANAPMWGSILASCRVHKSLELAETAAKMLFEMEPENAGNYVLLANAYAANKKWEEAASARKRMKETRVQKEKGMSWIEVKNRVYKFTSGEQKHPRIGEIHTKLDELIEELKISGYKVETEYELHDVSEKLKGEFLKKHSEKLALVFGLMSLPASVAIRIMKNLQICGDCHSFMKFASRVTKREIIVRDVNRFHHFRNGCCSCHDFW